MEFPVEIKTIDAILPPFAACPDAKLSGFNVDGTFSEYVLSWVHHVTPIPDNLSSVAAAPILCAVSSSSSADRSMLFDRPFLGSHCLSRTQAQPDQPR